jgi:hypothetical protein
MSTVARVKLAANLSALGRSVGDDGTMNWLSTFFLLLAAFLAVFWASCFSLGP